MSNIIIKDRFIIKFSGYELVYLQRDQISLFSLTGQREIESSNWSKSESHES